MPRGQSVPVVIANLDNETMQLGLTEDYLRSKVELRLRRNGIVPEPPNPARQFHVYVNISVLDNTFAFEVSFKRLVSYEVNGKSFTKFASTYSKVGLGSRGPASSAREFITNALLDGVDLLCNEILKSAQ